MYQLLCRKKPQRLGFGLCSSIFNRKIKTLVLASLISAIPKRQVRACCFLFLEEDRHKLVVLSIRREATWKDDNVFLKFMLCYMGSNIIYFCLCPCFLYLALIANIYSTFWVAYASLSDHHFQFPEGCSPISFTVPEVFYMSTAVSEDWGFSVNHITSGPVWFHRTWNCFVNVGRLPPGIVTSCAAQTHTGRDQLWLIFLANSANTQQELWNYQHYVFYMKQA